MNGKKHTSLAVKTARSTIMSCVLFGIVTLLVSLTIYAAALTKQYISMADGIARQARMAATHSTDPTPLADQTMEIYRSLTEEQRQKVGTEEYRSYFADVNFRQKGGAYDVLMHMLTGTLGFHEAIYDIYLAMYDRDTSAMVYFVDPDENASTRLLPGDWETVSYKGMLRFLDGNEDDVLYDIGYTKNYGLLCTVGVPIINKEDGRRTAFILVDVSLKNLLNGMKDFALKISLAILILTLLIAWAQARRIKHRLVRPINLIAEASQRFADKNERVDKEHFADLDIHTGDELESLVHTMSDMEHSLKEYGADLMKITAEKERISTELSLATEIQRAMLPHIFPPYPERHEFDIFAMMEPAREVGGDFYDFFLIDDNHLCLVIADVSGKGILAALFMMISKTILQSCAMLGVSTAEILTKTNEALCSNNQVEMFVTVWLGILEISSGRLTCANAGHEYPVLKKANGAFGLYKDKHSLAVGAMSGTRYQEYKLQLEKGDKLFLYTDGVPEASDAKEEMFGIERMLNALNSEPDANPEQMLHNIREAVSGFVNEAEQFDDLTMLGFQYNG